MWGDVFTQVSHNWYFNSKCKALEKKGSVLRDSLKL